MKKLLFVLIGGVAFAGLATYALLEWTTPPSQVERHAATEAFYEGLEPLQARIRAVEDPVVKEYLFAAGFDYTTGRGTQLARDFPDTRVEYAPHDLAVIGHYSDVRAYADGYIGGIMANWSTASQTHYINVRRPFLYPFSTDVTLQTVTLASGQTLPIDATENPDATDIQAYQYYENEIAFKNPSGGIMPQPASIQIRVRADVPSKVQTLRFENAQVGDQQTYDNYTLTITDLTPRFAQIRTERRDGGDMTGGQIRVDIGATDADGYPIQRAQMLSGRFDTPETTLAKIEEVLALADSDPDAARQTAQAYVESQAALATSAVFNGHLTTLEVYVADGRGTQTINRDITLPVVALPQWADAAPQDIIIDTAVIDPQLQMLLDGVPDVWTADDLPDNLSNWQGRGGLYYALPPRLSDIFISDFDRLERQGDLDFGPGTDTIDHEDWDIYSIQPMRIDFQPDAFPATPTRIKGEVAFVMVDQIDREKVSLNQLPEGVIVNQNRIMVTGDIYASLADDTMGGPLRLIALNDDGKPLKEFHAYRSMNQMDFYYHGHPASLLLLRRGDLSRVVVPVNHDLDTEAFDLENY